MEEIIELWDIKPHERWCLQEDIDELVDLLLDAEVTMPKDVLSIWPIYVEIDGKRHFTEGASLHMILTSQRTRKAKRLDERKMQTRIIPYHRFMHTLYNFVEVWLHQIPFMEGGRIDVDKFTFLELQRLMIGLME